MECHGIVCTRRKSNASTTFVLNSRRSIARWCLEPGRGCERLPIVRYGCIDIFVVWREHLAIGKWSWNFGIDIESIQFDIGTWGSCLLLTLDFANARMAQAVLCCLGVSRLWCIVCTRVRVHVCLFNFYDWCNNYRLGFTSKLGFCCAQASIFSRTRSCFVRFYSTKARPSCVHVLCRRMPMDKSVNIDSCHHHHNCESTRASVMFLLLLLFQTILCKT